MANRAIPTEKAKELNPLTREFYSRYTVDVAKNLLAKYLVRHVNSAEMVGKIVEVEAYRGKDDPASHAYKGMTPRNQVMFGKPGVAYVYFSYGYHNCLNIVTEPEGVPGAVLIRALEPISGLDLMKKNRGKDDLTDLANGPGKLTKAMMITSEMNGHDLVNSKELFVSEPTVSENFQIVATRRVGIKLGTEKIWRFCIKGSWYLSKK